MEKRPMPCRYCKTGEPIVFKVGGELYYARCDNPQCKRWDPYEFCATTVEKALRAWNNGNTAFSQERKLKR